MSQLPKIDPEFKSLIPPHTPEERAQLEQNILQKRKCHDAIVLWNGYIIDGHNRFEICEAHGIEFEVKDKDLKSREAAKIWILENQLARRNLSDVARIDLALMREQFLKEKAKKNRSMNGGDKKSGSELTKLSKVEVETINVREVTAAIAGVSEGTLSSYKRILKGASPGLLAQVQCGAIKIGTARRILDTEKSLKGAIGRYKFIFKHLPKCDEETAADIRKQLDGLSNQLRELLIKLKERSQNDATGGKNTGNDGTGNENAGNESTRTESEV